MKPKTITEIVDGIRDNVFAYVCERCGGGGMKDSAKCSDCGGTGLTNWNLEYVRTELTTLLSSLREGMEGKKRTDREQMSDDHIFDEGVSDCIELLDSVMK